VSNGQAGIDAIAFLGVAAKLQQMLSDGDHFVSVSLQPHAYGADNLRFAGSPSTLQALTQGEFSSLVNQIPHGSVWPVGGGELHLWDVYREILGAELAQRGLTIDEQSRYQEAFEYLYDTAADGKYCPSLAFRDYQAARQVYVQAAVEYKAEAAIFSDPVAKAQWEKVDEPRLRMARDMALNNWMTVGHKQEVEDALRTYETLSVKAPAAIWQKHRAQFDPNYPEQFSTAPNEMRFAPTSFLPWDALDVSWPRVVLPRATLTTLVSQAAPELAAAVAGGVDGAVKSVAFDYYPVSIVRPWIDPVMELFGSRAWKLSPDLEPFSDGGNPPKGRCPAYVDSVVLARNVEILREKTSSRPAPHRLGMLEHRTLEAVNRNLTRAMVTHIEPPKLLWERKWIEISPAMTALVTAPPNPAHIIVSRRHAGPPPPGIPSDH
jgi:hypothetical protein